MRVVWVLIKFRQGVTHADFGKGRPRNRALHAALGPFMKGPNVNFAIKPWLTTGAYDIVITLRVSNAKAGSRSFLRNLQKAVQRVTSKVDIVVGERPIPSWSK